MQDWFADDWITGVYQPRAYKLPDYKAIHTYEKGTRYNHSEITEFDLVQRTIERDKAALDKYGLQDQFISYISADRTHVEVRRQLSWIRDDFTLRT